MSDFARYLPLSQGPREPETKVTGNWSSEIAVILEQVADLLDGLTPEQWESRSMCDGWRIRDVAGHLVWRLGSSTGRMIVTAGRAWFGKRLNPMDAIGDLSIQAAEASRQAGVVAERERLAAQSQSNSFSF